jgi:hypothetical protein
MRRENPVHTYLDDGMVDAIDRAAKCEGISRSAYMRRLVIEEMTRRSRAAQGLPEHVGDRAALGRVADLLDGAS